MAFDPNRLNVIGYASGFTLWHYDGRPSRRHASGRPGPDLLAPGFFDAARDLLRPGDFLFANGNARHAILVVLDAGAGGVTLSALASSGLSATAALCS